jgi:hypothetical protein
VILKVGLGVSRSGFFLIMSIASEIQKNGFKANMSMHGEDVTLTQLETDGSTTETEIKAMIHGSNVFDPDRGSSFTTYDFVIYSIADDSDLAGIDPATLTAAKADVEWNGEYYRFDGTISERTPFAFIATFQKHRQSLRHRRGEQ